MTRPPGPTFGAHIARGRAMDRAKVLLELQGDDPRYRQLADLVAASKARLAAIPHPLNEHVEDLSMWAAAERAVVAELRRLDAQAPVPVPADVEPAASDIDPEQVPAP